MQIELADMTCLQKYKKCVNVQMNPTVEVISHICTTDGKRGSEMYAETLPLPHSNMLK